jgi:hypothetical protein
VPAKGGGLYPRHAKTREAAREWARSVVSDEVWGRLAEARADLEIYGQGPEVVAPKLARDDARAVDDALAEAAGLVDRAAEVAAGWEIPPFEPLNAALEALKAAMAEARQASHQALGAAVDEHMRMEFSDDWRKLDVVRPAPTRGTQDTPEVTARRQNFIRLASLGIGDAGLDAAEWATLAIALGIERPPRDQEFWDHLRRQWNSALVSVRTE